MYNIATIICNYNYSSYVIESIKSAINQRFTCNDVNHSIYFVDDGSSDNSWELVKENFCNNIKIVSTNDITYECYENKSGSLNLYKTDNRGASFARNFLIDMAISKNQYISILDSDDFMVSNKLDTLLSLINKYEEIGVAYADYIINKRNYSTYEYKEFYSIDGLYRSCIVHSGSLIKSSYLKMVQLDNGEYYKTSLHGPASKTFIGCTEDYDLWMRLSKKCIFAHCPMPLTIVNEHGNNQSSKMTPEIFQDNIRKMHG